MIPAFLMASLALPAVWMHNPDRLWAHSLSEQNGDLYPYRAPRRTLYVHRAHFMVQGPNESFLVQGREKAMPFKREIFFMVWKEEHGASVKLLSEANRVMEWGGYLTLLDPIHKTLLRSLPFRFSHFYDPFYVYRKVRPRHGKRKSNLQAPLGRSA